VTPVLSAEIIANHVGILGKTGSGKSNLAKVIAEQLLAAGERVVVLDPTGTWYGLRLTRARKPSPFKVVIFGGAHGDIPIAAHHGEEIAAALARSSTSAIIDTRQLTVKGRTTFATGFAETLLQRNVGVLYVIVDEAHLFAPQGKVPDPDAGKMLHAWNNLASLGRGVGLVLILISQRPAKLHKDSLTQIETLIAMRLIGPQDRAAIREWIRESADEAQGAEIMRSLVSLPTGTGWVWSPALDVLEKRSFPLASTLDTGTPSAAPDVVLGPIDVDAIRAQLGKVEEERKANDPTELRKQIAALKHQLEQRPTEQVVETVEKIVEIPVLNGQVHELTARARDLQALSASIALTSQEILAAIDRVQQTPTREREERAPRGVPAVPARGRGDTAVATLAPAAPRRDPAPASPAPASPDCDPKTLTKVQRAVLSVLAHFPEGRSPKQIAVMTGYAVGGSTMRTTIGGLRTAGFATPAGIEPVQITAAGREALGDYEPLPTGPDLAAYWMGQLPAGARNVLQALLAAHPRTLDQLALAEITGYAAGGSTMRTALGRLRTLELIDGFTVSPELLA